MSKGKSLKSFKMPEGILLRLRLRRTWRAEGSPSTLLPWMILRVCDRTGGQSLRSQRSFDRIASSRVLIISWRVNREFITMAWADLQEALQCRAIWNIDGDHEHLAVEVRVMYFDPFECLRARRGGRTPGEILSSVIKDFSVTSFLRNDSVVHASKYWIRRKR